MRSRSFDATGPGFVGGANACREQLPPVDRRLLHVDVLVMQAITSFQRRKVRTPSVGTRSPVMERRDVVSKACGVGLTAPVGIQRNDVL